MEPLDEEIKELLDHWLGSITCERLSIDQAFNAWYKGINPAHFNAIDQMTSKEARIKYVRYLMTGTTG